MKSLAMLALVLFGTAAMADIYDPYYPYPTHRPEVTTPYSICRDTSNAGRGYPVTMQSGGPYVCRDLGYPVLPQYYGGHITGSPYYFCCYDPDSY